VCAWGRQVIGTRSRSSFIKTSWHLYVRVGPRLLTSLGH
jgi:hypothetical protein